MRILFVAMPLVAFTCGLMIGLQRTAENHVTQRDVNGPVIPKVWAGYHPLTPHPMVDPNATCLKLKDTQVDANQVRRTLTEISGF